MADAADRMKASLRRSGASCRPRWCASVLASGEEARLGGEPRPHDPLLRHRGLHQAERGLTPTEVVRRLAEYLSVDDRRHPRSRAARVDQFMGDGIMAFWNAPSPVPGHAAGLPRRAGAQERLAAMRAQWEAGGPVRTRIGLHTGEVWWARSAPPQRFAYLRDWGRREPGESAGRPEQELRHVHPGQRGDARGRRASLRVAPTGPRRGGRPERGDRRLRLLGERRGARGRCSRLVIGTSRRWPRTSRDASTRPRRVSEPRRESGRATKRRSDGPASRAVRDRRPFPSGTESTCRAASKLARNREGFRPDPAIG